MFCNVGMDLFILGGQMIWKKGCGRTKRAGAVNTLEADYQ
jgi:hypothetical protein